MDIPRKAFLLMAWTLLATAGGPAAPLSRGLENSPRRCPQDAEEIRVPSAASLICLEFDKKDVLVGSVNIPLTVQITSLKEKPLKLVDFSPADDNGTEKLIKFAKSGEEELPLEGGVEVRSVYRFHFSIAENAEPRSYAIRVQLKYASKDPPPSAESFHLKVGGSGAVRLADNTRTVSAMTGEITTQHLEVKGAYYYPVRLRQVTIYSDPADLVARVAIPADVPIRNRKEVETIDVSFPVRKMELKDWISAFGSENKLWFEFEYEDDEKRVLKSRDALKLAVRPSVLALVSAILLGVLAGTIVKTDLKRLQVEGYITRRQKALFIVGTSVIGLIAALVALFGEVQVSVFKFNGSYDSPKVLFLIGLAATLAGPPLLYGILKSSKGQVGQDNPREQKE
ncbi:MAG TPA: hypothetical protein VF240_22560 [Pyrinomonadaceae bacterium]